MFEYYRSETARQILSFTRKPKLESYTGIYIVEHSEEKFDFADLITFSQVSNPKTNDLRSAFIMFNSHVNNFPVNYYSVSLSVHVFYLLVSNYNLRIDIAYHMSLSDI